MSYDMHFKLSLEGEEPEDVADARHARIGEERAYDFMGGGQTMTWYRCEEEMLAVSERHPKVLFILDVTNAEEPGTSPPERWFFKAGNYYKSKARVTFDDFDAAKMVPCKPA